MSSTFQPCTQQSPQKRTNPFSFSKGEGVRQLKDGRSRERAIGFAA